MGSGVAAVPVTDRVGRATAAFEQALREAPDVDLSWIDHPLRDDGWELAPDVLRLLWALVGSLRPQHVLEFGSGVSTLVLARASVHAGGGTVTSVDHDPAFALATAELLTPDDKDVVALADRAPRGSRPYGSASAGVFGRRLTPRLVSTLPI